MLLALYSNVLHQWIRIKISKQQAMVSIFLYKEKDGSMELEYDY